jgi:hypothetical protein
MKNSVLFMSLAVGIWGWLNQAWLVAALLVSPILMSSLINWRWDIDRSQFHRFANISVVLILSTLAYGYLTESDTNPIYSSLKWLPIVAFPVLLAQIYSVRNRVPLSALFSSMRGGSNPSQREIDFSVPFALLTIIAAGAANIQSSEYFLLAAIFVGAISWQAQPRNSSKIVWVLIFSTAIVASYFGHLGLEQLNAYIKEKSIVFFSDRSTDPFNFSTSIGQIGELKLSDRIEFHVIAKEPMLLHQSSYNYYSDNEWYASDVRFEPYRNEAITGEKNSYQLDIVQGFEKDLILALPDGTAAIRGLEGSRIARTEVGTFKISDPPEWAQYQVEYSGTRRSSTSPLDLLVPDQHRHWLQKISASLEFDKRSPEQIASTIKDFFQSQFLYTLYTPKQSSADQALSDFILERKAGHCEYFAMATVFLLRYAGIPARLANGYAVQEFDPALGMYTVRRRHAHAWAIAETAGSWKAVDTTPAQWLDVEADGAGDFQAVSDWLYGVLFRWNQWRAGPGIVGVNFLFGVILLLLLSYLCWNLRKGKKSSGLTEASEVLHPGEVNQLGLDSEFFLVAQDVQQRSQARIENESVVDWAGRVGDKDLETILQLHNRYRFDPLGLSEKQRETLRTSVGHWLNKKAIETQLKSKGLDAEHK